MDSREKPTRLDEDKPLTMPLKFIMAMIAFVGISVTAYITMIRDIGDEKKLNLAQDARLLFLEQRSADQREVLTEMRADLKANREQTALVIEMLKANRTTGRE